MNAIPPRKSRNDKRRVQENCDPDRLGVLEREITYTGSPYHKKNPGDYGLNPPANPRDKKTLCDKIGEVKQADAEKLLKDGVRKGLISQQMRGRYPQNIWSVADDGTPLEAQLENREKGTYHGYPLLDEYDPFREEILKRAKTHGH